MQKTNNNQKYKNYYAQNKINISDTQNVQKDEYELENNIYDFDKIIQKIKFSYKYDKKKNIKDEYLCNLILEILPNLSPLEKIEYLELLYSFNTNQEDKAYKYHIFQKITKNLNIIIQTEKNADYSKFIEILSKQGKFLEEENNNFYAFNCLKIKKSIQMYKIREEIKDKIISLLEDRKNFFLNLKKEEYIKLKEILCNSQKNKNFAINEILYAVNKIWLNKAIKFIQIMISLNDNDYSRKDQVNKIFDINGVYNYYFDYQSIKNFYPGPIDNYYISDYKDLWKDAINEDENYIIKNGLILDRDYILMKEKYWNIIKDIFGATNEIKRKINNLDLLLIKAIILDKRIISSNNLNLLRSKYIQIGRKENVSDLKEKIINYLNQYFGSKDNEKENEINGEEITNDERIKINISDFSDTKDKIKEEDDNNSLNGINVYENINLNDEIVINNDEEEKIIFYKLSKKNKQLLLEIFTAFINGIASYPSIFFEKLNLKDNDNIESIFNYYNKSKDILIIEIVKKNDYQFLIEKEKNKNNLYKCSLCNSFFPLKNRYNCKICNMSFYCSKRCAESLSNISHLKLHKYLDEFIKKKFDINEFLKLELDQSKYNDSLVGLNNLGNTCFINSSLQSLFNTYDLSKYFLSNYFKEEINKKNNLGYQGIFAESYAKLLLEVKTTIKSAINPIDFIRTFFLNNNSINIKGQQDAQEFLSILLDCLHEDLNRITKKPYIELEEQKDNENDYEASKRWWDSYRKREDSIIIDLFHGQFRSKIIGRNCGKSSITYEPFIFLGLPLPQAIDQKLFKFFFGNRCNVFGMNNNYKTTIFDFKKKAIETMRIYNYYDELTDDELLKIIEIVQIDNNKIIRKIYKNNELNDRAPLSSLIERDTDLETAIYEKSLNEKYFNIYIYPMNKDDYDKSYPIALSVTYHMSFKEIIEKNREKLKSLYLNPSFEDEIKIGLIHKISNSWIHYIMNFGSKEDCPLCQTEKNFCEIYEMYTIGNILEKIKKANPNYGPALFVAGNSQKTLTNRTLKFNGLYDHGLYNLSDCFKLFCEEELLQNDNLWYCNKCKKQHSAKKQIRLYKLPLYLIIQLKKFESNSNMFNASSNEKKETFIKYPVKNLNLSDYTENPDEKNESYDLYAVINHHGKMTQGHYTCICKINDKWFLFNDDKYFQINSPINKDAYLLFYKKNKI